MWVLEGSPHFLSERCVRVLVALLRAFIVHEPLTILSFYVPIIIVAAVSNDIWHNSVKRQLFVVSRDALVFGVVQLPSSIVVENVSEEIWISVEEELLVLLIVKELLFV